MNNSAAPRSSTARRYIALIGVGGLVATAILAGGTLPATAAEDGGSTIGHVEVSNTISLNGLTAEFTLTGLPGATVSQAGAVAFNVETNNLAGYNVTVQSATTTLVADTPANTDAIPIGALSVSELGVDFTPISATTPFVVHTQATRSVEGGDDLTNDYSVDIPFVNTDTYTVTLNYIATTL
jgi:hypothetical protein